MASLRSTPQRRMIRCVPLRRPGLLCCLQRHVGAGRVLLGLGTRP